MPDYKLTPEQEQRARELAATTSMGMIRARFMIALGDGDLPMYYTVDKDGNEIPVRLKDGDLTPEQEARARELSENSSLSFVYACQAIAIADGLIPGNVIAIDY